MTGHSDVFELEDPPAEAVALSYRALLDLLEAGVVRAGRAATSGAPGPRLSEAPARLLEAHPLVRLEASSKQTFNSGTLTWVPSLVLPSKRPSYRSPVGRGAPKSV
ncbi:MAG: hypothetical protein AAFU79_10920 [Myxococcota bacterium]